MMAMYAEDAIFTGPLNCTTGCRGKPAFQPVLERQANVIHETGKILDAQASGNTVTAHVEIRQDVYKNFGIERTHFIETTTIQDGKIASLHRQFDLADAETVRFASAQAAAAASAKPAGN